MGHTNSTANLSLPQFIGTDKPTWLGDINSAFSDIDAYVGTNDAAVSGAVADAASAVSQAASAVSTANAANTTAGNASTAATNAVGTANNAMSLVNQTNTKIGTLANLNTTDQTSIVNAINEVLSDTAGKAGSVSASSDGVKTYAQICNTLFGLVDSSKITVKSYLAYDNGSNVSICPIKRIGSEYVFISEAPNGRTAFKIASSSEVTAFTYSTATAADASATVVPAGQTFEIFY